MPKAAVRELKPFTCSWALSYQTAARHRHKGLRADHGSSEHNMNFFVVFLLRLVDRRGTPR